MPPKKQPTGTTPTGTSKKISEEVEAVRDYAKSIGASEEFCTKVESLSLMLASMLKAFMENLGGYSCARCAAPGSDQSAAQKRALKVAGFDVDSSPAKSLWCAVCSEKRTHYVLSSLSLAPSTERVNLTSNERKKVLSIIGEKDAFLGSTPQQIEIDHRVPMLRSESDEEAVDLNDKGAVMRKFMPLSRQSNLTKSRNCERCAETALRPPFLGINFWYEGNESYDTSLGCAGCGWAYPEKWKEALVEILRAKGRKGRRT